MVSRLNKTDLIKVKGQIPRLLCLLATSGRSPYGCRSLSTSSHDDSGCYRNHQWAFGHHQDGEKGCPNHTGWHLEGPDSLSQLDSLHIEGIVTRLR